MVQHVFWGSLRGSRGRSRAVGAALLAVGILLNAVFIIALLTSGGDIDPVVNIWLAESTQWIPVAVFVVVIVRTRFQRWDVILAAAAMTATAAGDTYYSIAMGSDGILPFPSMADVGYLLFYPLMLAALVAFVRRQHDPSVRAAWLDSAVASLGAASILAVLLRPLIDEALAGSNTFENVFAVAYPLADLVLIAVMAGTAASPTLNPGPRWQWLLIGLALFTGGDVAYALLEVNGAYVAGTLLDASWAVGMLLIAVWADAIPPETEGEAEPHRLRVPATAFGVFAGLLVLVFGSIFSISALALVLAALTVGLAAVPVMFRQSVLARLVDDQKRVVVKLEELDREKTEMIATVNHELRTPLTSIRGYLELVLDGDAGAIPKEATEMLTVVDHNASRLQGLVDDMLMMSRLDLGASAINRESIQLEDVLARVVQSVEPFARSRDVELQVEIAPERLTVSGDAVQLERAFHNLVDNAVKFTPAGGRVVVLARVDPEVPAGRGILVTVADTGMGIPTDEIDLLFRRFYRATNAQEGAVPGTGLGLSIVRSLIESHGGVIDVESVVGVGTNFGVRLPLAPVVVSSDLLGHP